MPGFRHPCPNSAPCESPSTPQIGTGCGRAPSKSVSPNVESLKQTSGSISGATPNSAHSAASHRSAVMSKSCVREAFE